MIIICFIRNILYLIINRDIVSIFNNSLNFLNSIKDLNTTVISVEVTLISVTFIFLPIIIDHKSNEYYLGFKVSDWIFYLRKKHILGIDDTSFTWIVEFLIFIVSFIGFIFDYKLILIISFAGFLIYICYKVLYYLKILSRDDYKKEIEKEFEVKSINEVDYLINVIKKNKQEKNIETLEFLVENYSKKYEKIFNVIYGNIIASGSQSLICEMFNTIKNNGQGKNIKIYSGDLRNYIERNINRDNMFDILAIADYFIYNDFETSFKENKYCDTFLNVYYAFSYAVGIGNEERKRLFKDILTSFTYIIIEKKCESELEKELRYKYILDFLKHLVTKGDYKEVNFLLQRIQEDYKYNYYGKNFDIFISFLIYLYYIIEIEKEPYVKNEDKVQTRKVYDVLIDIINKENMVISPFINIDELFMKIDNIQHGWERLFFDDYETTLIKDAASDKAVLIAKLSLYILHLEHNKRLVEEKELLLFQGYFKNNVLSENIVNKIKKFCQFANVKINNEMIKRYSEKLYSLYKYHMLENTINLKDINSALKKYSDKILNKTKESKIINATECKKISKYIFSGIYLKSEIIDYANRDFFKYFNPQNIFEIGVLRKIKKSKIKKIKYSFDDFNSAIMIIKNTRSNYKLIGSKNDYLSNQMKKNNCYDKFTHIDIDVACMHLLIDKYKCSIKNVYLVVSKLSRKNIINNILKNKENNIISYGENFKVDMTDEELIKYYQNKFVKISIVFEYSLDIVNSKGFFFVDKDLD